MYPKEREQSIPMSITKVNPSFYIYFVCPSKHASFKRQMKEIMAVMTLTVR